MSVTYTVRWRTADATAWAPEDEIGGLTSTSVALTGLRPGTRYDVQVVAVAGDGPSSAPVQGSRWTAPSAPEGPASSAVLAETAELAWAQVPGAAEYRVVQSPGDGGASERIRTVAAPQGAESVSVALEGLEESTAYTVRVVAVGPDGDTSAASPSTTVTTTALATGGTVTEGTGSAAGYRIHTFTSTGEDGTFTLNAVRDLEYLVVGGGASGTRGHCGVYWGHGGGGGGVSTGTVASSAPGTFAVTVGTGGAGSTTISCNDDHRGNDGGPSRLRREAGDVLVAEATGGIGAVGRGTVDGRTASAVGGTSGSGTIDGVAAGPNAGGDGSSAGGLGAGGGGGAGASGSALAGGAGRASAITGTEVVYGGGGAGRSNDGPGTPGDGGGGQGGTSGVDGLGGGGSDAWSTAQQAFSSGGSGVVILRYRVAP
jgi:hypothetical protein